MRRVVILGWTACLIGCLIAVGPRPACAQQISANLYGRIRNPKGQGVAGARVRVVRLSTGLAREVSTNAHGDYSFLDLPAGRYQFTVLARGYATLLNSHLELQMGQNANYSPTLTVSVQPRAQTVTTQPRQIETTRSANVLTITRTQLDELPINRRDYLNFVLLNSQVKPDDTPLSAVFPTSGLNFNGQRARGNEVTVDGSDIVTQSTGSVQWTLPLDAVRAFQVMPNDYQPENGRATGGVVNVLTQSGTNNFHGSAYGFLRNSRIQARNPFSEQVDPTTGVTTGVKQPYTRTQAGFSLGGDLQQNKFFYYLSGEALLKHATGFSAIGANNFGLTSATIPCVSSSLLMTAAQASYFKNAIQSAGGCSSPSATPLIQAAQLYGAASNTALNGESEATALLNSTTGVPTTFPLPVDCNYLVTGSCGPSNVAPLPQSYVGLTSLIGNYPTREKSYRGAVRLDRIWNQNQRSFLFVSLTPSYQTGIQVNTPDQSLGLNAGSRGSTMHFLDQTAIGQHTIAFSNTMVDVIRFQWSRRSVNFSYSPLTTTVGSTVTYPGTNPGVNIPGVAFLGREPYSTIQRTEKRYEGADMLTWVHGRHSFKFGVDASLLDVASTPSQLFDLNYGGVYDFGSVSANFLQAGLPAFTPVQAYGLGLPQGFTQGIGNSYQPFKDKLLGGFAQDTWRVTQRLTLNYGVRYDVGLTPLLPPETTYNQAAEQTMNVVQGLPRDYKDVSPRLGIAFDPTGSGKTVVRAGFGMFYDMAPLALIYDATAADGAFSTQLQLPAGLPTGTTVTTGNATQVLNAASVFQGVVGGIPTVTSAGTTVCGGNAPANLGFDCTSQRFNPTLINSLFANQSYLAAGFPLAQLPFTLPVAGNFVNAYSEQGSLSVEHQFSHNYTINVAYTWIHGLHLYRARNINQPNASLLANNFADAIKAGLQPSDPLTVAVPLGTPNSCISTSGTSSVQVISSGMLGAGYASPNCTGTSFGYIGTPSVFNDFRPSGPNPSYGGAYMANYDQLLALAKQGGYPTGFGSVPVPWGNVNQQESSGSSLYNGLTVSVTKRLSDNFEFLSSWTWSHALDDSTDLTTVLEPQNNSNPNLAWGNSTFDQRQRWVTSAIINSPYHSKDKGFLKKLLANSYMAPIVVVASGRPYSVLSGADYNLNFNANTDRPSVVAPGTSGAVSSPYISNAAFIAPTDCAGIPASVHSPFGQTVAVQPYGCTGNLGRNTFVTPSYFNIDLRLDKKFYINDTLNFEFIAEGFNLLNRFNTESVNLVCNPAAGSTCTAGQPSAVFNPRQFQFALKLNF